jgi:hypothetical protein
MEENYRSVVSISPLTPVFKGHLGGYQDFGYMTKDFSSILLDKTILVMSAISQIPHLFKQWEISTCKNNHQ